MKYNETQDAQSDLSSIGTPVTDDRRGLLIRFFGIYGNCSVRENQPPDATLQLMVKARAGRSAEFIPLSKITSAIDSTVSTVEPMRLSQ